MMMERYVIKGTDVIMDMKKEKRVENVLQELNELNEVNSLLKELWMNAVREKYELVEKVKDLNDEIADYEIKELILEEQENG